MSISLPKSAVILVVLGGVWWLGRDGGGAPPEAGASPGTAPASGTPTAPDPAMRSRLELAVTSAANAADCGYTEVGYDRRSPEDEARRLVALMKSASQGPRGEEPPPGTAVDYVEGRPGAAWQVAVNPGPTDDADALVIEGFGADLSTPLFRRRVPCS